MGILLARVTLEQRYYFYVQKGEGRFSYIVQAIFSNGLGRLDLVAIERDSEAKRDGYLASLYIRVLDETMETIYNLGVYFIRDNVSIYTAKEAKRWFKDYVIDVLEWPLYLLELNTVKHLQFYPKRYVCKVYLDTKSVAGSDEGIKEKLGEVLEEA